MGIEGEEIQAKDICNIFNKIIAENFTNLKKEMPIQVQEASKIPNRHDQNIVILSQHIVSKTTSTENKERILKSVREKSQKTYTGKLIKIIQISQQKL
jgi:3-dehydroquinate dehydratase